ncbi:MAG: phosphoglycerate kinase [Bdellovibrionaceae bacterium]|jgi:phosphoglycerate kinase|nr:phosphoglycerate kinase [Pseudobdellovibrionaceae bacterium]
MVSKSLDGATFIKDLEIRDKVIFLRVDFNVPIKDGVIQDDFRIQAAVPTIKYALSEGAKIVIGTHFGRPEPGNYDQPEFSLEPVAAKLGELLGLDVLLVADPLSDTPKALLTMVKDNKVIMLENLRFNASETKNGDQLVNAIKNYIDIYVNDAFGASHRAHESIVALPKEITTRAYGMLIKKEVEMLDHVLHNPEAPYVAILGGAKVSDKIEIIDNLIDKVDCFIIGGAMAYTFLEAKGLQVGKSLVEVEKLTFARKFLKRVEVRGIKLLLPIDHLTLPSFNSPIDQLKKSPGPNIDGDEMGLDIGPKSRELFMNEIIKAKTVFWNGPMGVFEKEGLSEGTFAIAKAMSECGGITVVGGGDSAAAAKVSGYAEAFSHISTGGGASLEYLQGAALPGLRALRGKFN